MYIKNFERFNQSTPKRDIDEIIKQYFATALWTEEVSNEDLEDKTIYDFSDKAREYVKKEIEWFINTAGSSLNGLADDQIGHDIWLSRNGHGAGFFDRGLEIENEELLMELSHQLGEQYIYVNSKGKICFEYNNEKYKNFNIDKYKKKKEFDRNVKKYNL